MLNLTDADKRDIVRYIEEVKVVNESWNPVYVTSTD